jgi:resuscitation-promoting factor RpfA
MTNNAMHNAASGSEESHVDRAMRGPTPDNPSLSLKTRLKRAAFFDKRERQVAAGKADPVDPTAGLPVQVAEDALMAHWSGGSVKEQRPRV